MRLGIAQFYLLDRVQPACGTAKKPPMRGLARRAARSANPKKRLDRSGARGKAENNAEKIRTKMPATKAGTVLACG